MAGALAGTVNAIAGGGTLIAYPTLIALGLPPTAANITSQIGLCSGYVGGVHAYRRELAGQRGHLVGLIPPGVAGACLGAGLLLLTPGDVFERLVPLLVLTSSCLLLVQPLVTRRVSRASAQDGHDRTTIAARLCAFAAGVYGAYFSAGLGVLLLALLGMTVMGGLQRLNALKSALSLAIVAAGAMAYVASDLVHWAMVAVLVPAAGAGGLLGGRLARSLPPAALRNGVSVAGIVLAVVLMARG